MTNLTIERELYDLLYAESQEWRRDINFLVGTADYAEAFIDVLMAQAGKDLTLALPQILSVELPTRRPEGYEHKSCHPALVLDYRPGLFDLLDEEPDYYLPVLEELLHLAIRLAGVDMVRIVDRRQAYWLAPSGFGFALITE